MDEGSIPSGSTSASPNLRIIEVGTYFLHMYMLIAVRIKSFQNRFSIDIELY